MKNENDPFKYKILDAKQLAVKVTANSLYGQLGAQTSPVCKRDIAAFLANCSHEIGNGDGPSVINNTSTGTTENGPWSTGMWSD